MLFLNYFLLTFSYLSYYLLITQVVIFSSSKWFGDQDSGLYLVQIKITKSMSTELMNKVSGKGVIKSLYYTGFQNKGTAF